MQNGPFLVKALLIYLITDVALFFEVGKNMGSSQVKQTADLILEDYSHFKPEDYILCFNRAKKGHYGKLFDRLDGQIIMEWLMSFDNERDGEIEVLQASHNKRLKELERQSLLPVNAQGLPQIQVEDQGKDQLFVENMNKLLTTLKANKAARDAQKLQNQTMRRVDPITAMHQRWLKQFDEIWERQGYPARRQITRYGMLKNPFWFPNNNSDWRPEFIKRKLNANDYLEHKQWQYQLATLPADKRMKFYLTKYPKNEQTTDNS